MAPEQITDASKADARSDLFSLGAMTFRLLARRNVHEAETDAEQLIAMATKPMQNVVCAMITVASDRGDGGIDMATWMQLPPEEQKQHRLQLTRIDAGLAMPEEMSNGLPVAAVLQLHLSQPPGAQHCNCGCQNQNHEQQGTKSCSGSQLALQLFKLAA